VSISDGYIKNLKLLDLIADFLGLVALKDIHFEGFHSKFDLFVTGDEVSLNGIKLHSESVDMDANFVIRGMKGLEGDMLVRLPGELIRQSFKMKLLLLLTREKLPSADFEFQIGGTIQNPRIKWLDTKFKQYLRKSLSKRGQKAIERQIDEAISPFFERQ